MARKSQPRFRREGEPPRIELTNDDDAILKHVYRHRFISSQDLFRLFPHRSQDKLSRRLMLLFRAGYLDRPRSQVDYFRDEGGSRPYIVALDNGGARHLKESVGMPIGPTDWRARNRTYTRENMDHTLAITRFLVDLEVAGRNRPEFSLMPFDEILRAAPDRTKSLPIPSQWSVPVAWRGSRATIKLAPDAVFGLRIARGARPALQNFIFLEIDRGSMTIAPSERTLESEAFVHRASVLRKLLCYAESYRQKLLQEHLGIMGGRMLMLTTSEKRAQAMREAAVEFVVGPLKIPPGLLLFGVQTNSTDPFEMTFENAAGIRVSLLP